MSLLVNDVSQEPGVFHYVFRRGGDGAGDREGAEKYLQAQGCTRVLHYANSDGAYSSFGIVESIDVVRQRAREPRYD